MARHSSTPRAIRDERRKQAHIGAELRKIPAIKSDRWMSAERLKDNATKHFELIAALHKRNDPTARRKLREMRDVTYDTDPAPTCRGAWDDKAKKGKQSRPVIGRDGKHQRIMKGQSARNSQAKGL